MNFQSSGSRGKGRSCGRGCGGHRSSGGGKGHDRGRHRSCCRGQGKGKADNSNNDVDVQWSDQASDVTIQPFASVLGPTVNLPHSPLQIFLLFFTRAIIDPIVVETRNQQICCSVFRKRKLENLYRENITLLCFLYANGINKLPYIYI